jgi:hypothetical protein
MIVLRELRSNMYIILKEKESTSKRLGKASEKIWKIVGKTV